MLVVVSSQTSPCIGGGAIGAIADSVTKFPAICFVPLLSMLVTRCPKIVVEKNTIKKQDIKKRLLHKIRVGLTIIVYIFITYKNRLI